MAYRSRNLCQNVVTKGIEMSWQRYIPAALAAIGIGLALSALAVWAVRPAQNDGSRLQPSPHPAPPKPAPPPSVPLVSYPASCRPSLTTAASAMIHVQHLTETVGPRVAGSAKEREAIDYVIRQLTDMGYTPKRQAVSLWNQMTSSNVIATLPGNGRVVIIGAHLDSVARAPGANDNASGVAVLLELGRHFRERKPLPTVHLVFFCAEEGQYRNGRSVKGTGRRGSAVYAKSLSAETRSRLTAMVNMDMVGAGPPKLNIGDMSSKGHEPALQCLDVARQLKVPVEFDQFGGMSDYRPFHDAGLPIVALAWGNDPSHHTPRDRAEIIDPKKLEQTFAVVAAYVEAIQ